MHARWWVALATPLLLQGCGDSGIAWTPNIRKKLGTKLATVGDGGGNDEYFRNSGVVISGDTYFAVNGVHPIDQSDQRLTKSYPKSVIQAKISDDTVVNQWKFDGTTVGRNVDLEGLSWGPEGEGVALYIGCEYNFVYRLDLTTGKVTGTWDANAVAGDQPDDKGIEAITYNSKKKTFYLGIQQTGVVHEVTLSEGGKIEAVGSFTAAASPSGLFYHATKDVIYVLCGTQTNGPQYLYQYGVDGTQNCLLTIPASLGLARTDGFYINGDVAYIADSQGPMHDQALGYNLYEVDWSDDLCTPAP